MALAITINLFWTAVQMERPLGLTGEPGLATKVAANHGLAGWPAGEDLAESWKEERMGEALSIPS